MALSQSRHRFLVRSIVVLILLFLFNGGLKYFFRVYPYVSSECDYLDVEIPSKKRSLEQVEDYFRQEGGHGQLCIATTRKWWNIFDFSHRRWQFCHEESPECLAKARHAQAERFKIFHPDQ